MGRKQTNGFGVVARTSVSLLVLGFGSALFGAMVVGPGLGSFLNRDDRSAAKRIPAETRIASANLSSEDNLSLRETSPPVEDEPPAAVTSTTPEAEPVTEPATVPEEETENPDLVRYAEGTGDATGVPPDELPGTATTQPAVATSSPARIGDAASSDRSSREPVVEPSEGRREATPVSTRRSVAEPKRERTDDSAPRSQRSRTEESSVDSKPEQKPEVEPRRRRTPEVEAEPESTSRRSRRESATAPESRTERTATSSTEPVKRRAERTERERANPREEPEKRRPERTADASKADADRRKPERLATTPRIEPDKRKVERVESSKPFAPRESATPETPVPEGKLFRVRVGRVTTREDAEKLRDDLRDSVGIDAFLVRSGEGFRVQTGAYRARANAEKIAAELRAGSFRPEVTED